MKVSRASFWLVLCGLFAFHAMVLFAGFFAPYDFQSQSRDLPFAPPTQVHFVDAHGNFHLRPFIHPWKPSDENPERYVEDTAVVVPMRFFVPGMQYKILGMIASRWHLFGVEGQGRIFLWGSDAYGRDQFSRFLYGGQISVVAGLLAALLSLSIGAALGTLSGYYARWVDEIIMRGAELFLALPWLYFLFAVRAFLPLHVSPTQALMLLVAVIGIVGWARPARLVRGIALSARERNFVLAARGFGATDGYILWRHILPQASSVLLTQGALLLPQYILAEVTLSFLGLGVGEPVPSWGNLLASLQQYNVLASYSWMFLPALALVPLFLMYQALANALQDRVGHTAL